MGTDEILPKLTRGTLGVVPAASCEWVIMCDNAMVDQNGKPTLVGLFEQFTGPSAPLQIVSAFVVVRLRGANGQPTSRVRIDLTGPNDQRLVEVEGDVEFKAQAATNMNISLGGLILPDFGRYTVSVWLDGAPAAGMVFDAVQNPPAASGPQST